MQFYLDGYRPGDPDILAAAPDAVTRSSGFPETIDVLIVGAGPAGMLLAAQLSTFSGISTRLVERRPGPLQVGQADGVACRTVEMFDAFGLSARLLRESYWVNETVFWRPSPEDRARIVRTGRIQDTEDGLSEFPHLIVNQARLLQYLQEYMEKAPTRLVPDFGIELVDLKVEQGGEHPVVVTLRDVATGTQTQVRTKYAVGCDGARSRVRDAIGAHATRRLCQPRPGASSTCWPSPIFRTSGSRPRFSPATRATSCSSRAKAATSCGSMSIWARQSRTIAMRSGFARHRRR